MRVRVLDLDGAVTAQPFMADLLGQGEADVVDARDLAPKLRIVANRSALRTLHNRLRRREDEPEMLFVGSGDFHHLTYMLLQRLDKPVAIIHFDNHPDWVRFPASVNCGSWVNRALEHPDVRRVVTIGPCSHDLANPEIKTANLPAIREGRLELYAWLAQPTRLWGAPVNGPGVRTHAGQLVWRNVANECWSEFVAELCARLPACPLWVTIDKDVLSRDEAVTNWDQGAMSLAHVTEAVQVMALHREVLGIDVCGDYSVPRFRDPFRAMLSASDRPRQLPSEGLACAVNDAANRRLIDLASVVLS